jgi:hypothetical protein
MEFPVRSANGAFARKTSDERLSTGLPTVYQLEVSRQWAKRANCLLAGLGHARREEFEQSRDDFEGALLLHPVTRAGDEMGAGHT